MSGSKIFIYLLVGLRQSGLGCSVCPDNSSLEKSGLLVVKSDKEKFVFVYSLRSTYYAPVHNSAYLLFWNARVAGKTLQMSQPSTISSRCQWISVSGQVRLETSKRSQSPGMRGSLSSAKTKRPFNFIHLSKCIDNSVDGSVCQKEGLQWGIKRCR